MQTLEEINAKERCRKCGTELDRVHRGKFMKNFLFWLNFKKYYCFGCLKVRWRWQNKAQFGCNTNHSYGHLTVENH